MASTNATVFGLDVRSRLPLSLIEGCAAVSTGRPLDVTALDPDEQRAWPREQAELICNEPDRDGEVFFRIEAHPEAGYLAWGPNHGVHLLSGDGRRLACAPQGAAEHAWQRLLISQVLPFATLLQGLEVFHASAVALRGQALAMLGASGAGKTSVALALCRLGAEFLADDVVALEVDDDRLTAHPGTRIAGLDHREAQRLEMGGEPREESVIAVNEREQLIRMRGASGPAPLAALFFLDRRLDGPATPRFEALADAGPLLSATFNFVLDTPERLRSLLEVCALAARCRTERILAGPDVNATQIAQAIERRLGSPS